MAPYQRLRQAFALYDFARRRVAAHIHSWHPELSEEEVRALVRERFRRRLLDERADQKVN